MIRGSPADAAGVQKGDIVIEADGLPVRSAAQLRNKIGLTRVGDRVQLVLDRNGELHTAVVEVEAVVRSTASPSR